MHKIQLAVFDMAGTTVRDQSEVEDCFAKAAAETGLIVTPEQIKAAQGWSKLYVFETFWKEKLGENHPEWQEKVNRSYDHFRKVLEDHYANSEIVPTEGCLNTLKWLKARGVKVVLTTGFYRKVCNIILGKLGWDEGLDENYVQQGNGLIDQSITSDEVPNGRPAPDMLHKAMKTFGIEDPKAVFKVGDTPSDLKAGATAGVALSVGLTNGTHTAGQLSAHPSHGLLGSMAEIPAFLEKHATFPNEV